MAGVGRSETSNGFIQMWFTLFLGVLQVIPTHIETARAQTEAFVQSDINELRQLVEEVALKSDLTSQTFTIGENGAVKTPHMGLLRQWNSALRFDPALLDFGEHAVGMPEIRTVRVINPHPENTLRMLAISGTTPHFHCSFFQEKELPPGGNTTFDVVFLARMPGNVENTIFIRTSAGTTPYQVFGTGVPNPYRLRPFLGARVPLNSSFSPLIKMHNPFSSGLMVTEMYSSGGDLHLELPTGSQEAPQHQWEIAPYQTKSVMRASFVGRVENNHTAFIRIKTNRTSLKHGPLEVEDGEFLMLPVEVEVSSVPGIYSSLEMMDFGTLRTQDEPKTIPLYILNTGPKVVHISSVALVRANQAVSIDFSPIGLRPSDTHVRVANVTFHPCRANHTRLWSGKIIVKTKEKAFKLQIPYQAHVLQGILRYSRNNTLFYLSDPPPQKATDRNLSLTNLFNFTVVLHNMKLVDNTRDVFRIKNISLPVSIAPQETFSDLVLRFNPADASHPVSTTLKLSTNASVFTVPIYAYTGKLKFVINSDKDKQVDFGTMSVTDTRTTTIEVVNNNPVEVPLVMFSCTLEKCFMLLRRIERIDDSNMEGSQDTVIPSHKAIVIPAGHMAVFDVTVTAPLTEGQFIGEVIFSTEYEEKRILAMLKTVEGYLSVRPDLITLKPAFPGYAQSQSITVWNSFSHRLRIESIAPDPLDDRFYYKPPIKVVHVEVEAHKKQKIGRIVFDSRKVCATDCYVGLPPNSQKAELWLSSLTLPEETQDIDKLSYNYLRNKWYKLVESGHTSVNTTMYLDSNLVKRIPIHVQAELEWPALADKREARFPLTYIGNTSMFEVLLINPTDRLVIAQLLPISAYQDPAGALDLLAESEQMDPEFIEIDDPNVFYVADLKDKTSPGKCLRTHREAIENSVGVKPSPDALTVALKPRQNITIHLGFRPTDTRERYSLILIRNNLTVLDAVVVQGQGGAGDMRLNNKRPGVNSNLLFELKSSHLVDCNRTSPKARAPPNFTVKRTFNMKNTGQLPLSIETFLINGQTCEGFGFRVLQCRAMEILPNETRRLDIAFTPDFTLNRVTRELEVVTYMGENLSFTLIATLPPNMLAPCTAALPRPHWEIPLHLLSVCLMTLLFLVIVAVSYLETVRYLEPTATQPKLSEADRAELNTLKPFDLRNIAGLKSSLGSGDRGGDGSGGGIGGGRGVAAATSKTKSSATSLLSVLGEKLNIFSGSGSNSTSRSASSSVANNTRQSESRGSVDSDKTQVSNLSSTTSSAPKMVNKSTSSLYTSHDRRGTRNKRGLPPDFENSWDSVSNSKSRDYSDGKLVTSETVEEIHPDNTMDYDTSYQKLNSRGKGKSRDRSTSRDDMERNSGQRLEVKDLDRDETSSTTTEESNVDSEYSERSNKQFLDDDASLSESGASAAPVEDQESEAARLASQRFRNVKGKTKTRKGSSKASTKSTFNGDICRPSTLELPYTTALEAGRRADSFDKEPTSPHSIAAKVAAKATKKTIKIPKTKHPDSDATSTTSSEPDKDSPLPMWDQAKPIPSHVARPSAQARQPSGAAARNAAAAAAANAQGGRPISYSSAVSGASREEGETTIKPKLSKRLSAPEERSAFSTVGDKAAHPGTIGTKQSHVKSSKPRSAGLPTQPPTWTQVGPETSSSSDTNSGSSAGPASPSFFGTSVGKLDQGSVLPKSKKRSVPPSQFTFAGDTLVPSLWENPIAKAPMPSAPPGLPPPSANQASGGLGDWLGFGVSHAPPASSMWEPTPTSPPSSSAATWSTNAGSPGLSQSGFFQPSTLWSSPGNLDTSWHGNTSDLFNSFIWSSSSDNNSSLLDTSGVLNGQDEEATPRAFDPFGSSIWGPPLNGVGNNSSKLWTDMNGHDNK